MKCKLWHLHLQHLHFDKPCLAHAVTLDVTSALNCVNCTELREHGNGLLAEAHCSQLQTGRMAAVLLGSPFGLDAETAVHVGETLPDQGLEVQKAVEMLEFLPTQLQLLSPQVANVGATARHAA